LENFLKIFLEIFLEILIHIFKKKKWTDRRRIGF
jgi:hypothetical protein